MTYTAILANKVICGMGRLGPSLLVLASAALYSASMPPVAAHGLAWVALVPLFVAVARTRPLAAAALGLAWGIGISAGTASWMPAMARDYFERPAWLGWLVLLGTGVAHAGLPCALFAGWASWIVRRGAGGPILLALGWGGYELVRGRVCEDPWALAAYSQVGWPALLQSASLVGPYGVGMLVAAVNAVLAMAVVPTLRPARPWLSILVVAATAAADLALGARRLAAPLPAASMPVAVVQAGIGRALRWRPEYRTLGLAEHLALTARAAPARPVLVVWPEYAVSFYPAEQGPEQARLLDGSARLDADLVLGAPHYAFGTGGDTSYYNSVFLLHAGALAGRYDKRRLVPFAETTGTTAFTPGETPLVLPSRAGRLGPLVCFEAMFPELVRATVLDGAEILVNLSNDSWFASGAAARHHLDIASVRAIETDRYLLRAAPTGLSAVVDPRGRLLATSGRDRPEVLTANLAPSSTTTPYVRLGDAPLVALIVAAILLASRRASTTPEHTPY